jgi:hypothetical protein
MSLTELILVSVIPAGGGTVVNLSYGVWNIMANSAHSLSAAFFYNMQFLAMALRTNLEAVSNDAVNF